MMSRIGVRRSKCAGRDWGGASAPDTVLRGLGLQAQQGFHGVQRKGFEQ